MAHAARLLGAVDAAWQHGGLDTPSYYQQRLDRAASLARVSLGNHVFAAARAEGMAILPAILAGHVTDIETPLAETDLESNSPEGDLLTPRQQQVVALLVAGRSDRQIAQDLFISHRTASHHVAAIMEKLNARSRGEAAVRAVRDGLI
jgi:DNA-binding NarL/FixJ family response regulator